MDRLNQQMETINGLSAYAGFFSLLWTTWFLTSAYDVRFVTDSIFERCCRAVHLGVLVGFVTVSPNFNLARQDSQVFQTFSLILMVSRMCLGIEYGSIFLQAWKYKKTRWQLATMSGLNFFNGFVYLGVSFRFSPDNPRLFFSWYAVCAVELITVMFIAVTYPILSFQGTPLIRRLSLLTLIIFGEGITVACSNITQVINAQGNSAWTSGTIGTVTACVTITYLAFMLYFDSVSRLQLPPWHQLSWAILHFPLHLALTLFTEGCSQFIIFWKATEVENIIISEWNNLLLEAVEESTQDFSQPFRAWLDEYFDTVPPLYLMYRFQLNDTLDEIATLDGTSLETLRDVVRTGNISAINEATENDSRIKQAVLDWTTMSFVVMNIASAELGLDYYEDELQARGVVGEAASEALGTLDTQLDVSYRGFFRMRVVFQYTFACGGAVIGLFAILSAIGRQEKWTRWAVLRTVINLVIAVCVALVAALTQIGDLPTALFLMTPWVLPPLAILFFLLLVLHHLPEGPFSRCLSVKRWRKSKGESEKREGPEGHVEERDVESANPGAVLSEERIGDAGVSSEGTLVAKDAPTTESSARGSRSG
ncbi:hypothetical protein F5X68DRAFT_238875 [Plectosphaerella plurivora]|uniref:Transmembrane protein n=1 Tax=Plectosphaerella plurivora TaxID=936078 RepID=A0A9P8VLI1_9PEZI|nr:hypothetical protein F5X68DRAFT_238875 [Plectosphaerella plurivora]